MSHSWSPSLTNAHLFLPEPAPARVGNGSFLPPTEADRSRGGLWGGVGAQLTNRKRTQVVQLGSDLEFGFLVLPDSGVTALCRPRGDQSDRSLCPQINLPSD